MYFVQKFKLNRKQLYFAVRVPSDCKEFTDVAVNRQNINIGTLKREIVNNLKDNLT